jgi:hypothetical protein
VAAQALRGTAHDAQAQAVTGHQGCRVRVLGWFKGLRHGARLKAHTVVADAQDEAGITVNTPAVTARIAQERPVIIRSAC